MSTVFPLVVFFLLKKLKMVLERKLVFYVDLEVGLTGDNFDVNLAKREVDCDTDVTLVTLLTRVFLELILSNPGSATYATFDLSFFN